MRRRERFYQIGFYTTDGCFSVLSRKELHNHFPTWERAHKKCKELQPQYKHRLDVHIR